MNEYALDLDPLEEAMLETFQCPACLHVNGEVNIVGRYQQSVNTVINGDLKQLAEVKRVRCEHCGSVFENKTYL